MRLAAGRSTFAISIPVAAKIGSSHFGLLDEPCLAEPLSVPDRIAKLQSRSRGKTREHCNPLPALLLECAIADFLVAALKVGGRRNSFPPFASVHRMSRLSGRMLRLDQ